MTLIQTHTRESGYLVQTVAPGPLTHVRQFIGQGLGYIWAIADQGGESGIARFTEAGEYVDFNLTVEGGPSGKVGALDARSRVWAGAQALYGHTADDLLHPVEEISLNDGTHTFKAMGMVFLDRFSASIGPQLYIIGYNINVPGTIRCFALDQDTLALTYGNSIATTQLVVDYIGLVEGPLGDLWGTDINNLDEVIRVDRATLDCNLVSVSVARNYGCTAACWADGLFWVGGSDRGPGAGPVQLTGMRSTGNIERLLVFGVDVEELSALKWDGEYLWAAVSGNVSGSGSGTNRILKIDASGGTPSIVDTFLWGESATGLRDGLGERIWDIHLLDEPEKFSIPELGDATFWIDASRRPAPGLIKATTLLEFEHLPNLARGAALADRMRASTSAFRPRSLDLPGGTPGMYVNSSDKLISENSASDFSCLHDGTGGTLAFFMHGLSSFAGQEVLNTLGSVSTSNKGILVRWNGSGGGRNLEVRIGHGGGGSWLFAEVSAAWSVPPNTDAVILVNYDHAAPEAERLIVRVLFEFDESLTIISATTIGTAGTGAPTQTPSIGGGSQGFYMPEMIIVPGPRLAEVQMARIEKYLARHYG